jgi:hypothetical protein
VDHAYSQHLSRISKLLLAGTGLAFAWVLLSFALGLSASQAHADEDGGLLGTVSSTVESTTSTVTTVVEDTTAAIVEPVAPVVQQVVQTAPAPVAPVVDTVESAVAPVAPVVSAVTGTVTEITDSGVVAPIVDSTVDVVGAVPVVGEVVSALGVDTAASAVGSSVDGVLQGATGVVTGPVVGSVVDTVTGVVDTTTGAVITPIVPVLPPASSLDDALVGTVATTQTDAAAGPLEMLARAAYLTGATAWLAVTSDVSTALFATDSAFVSGGIAGGMFALLGSVMQAESVLVGPGGAGPGAWVLVALGLVVAYRAWMRRTGLENDVAPPAPAYSTDVSPD